MSQRTERGKDERAEEDAIMTGEPIDHPRPVEPATSTRDKGVEPVEDDKQHGTRGEQNRRQ